MIKHILTLVWNKKRSNILLVLEIFFAFLVLFAIFAFAIYYLRQYNTPLGFDTKDIMVAHLTMPDDADSLMRVEMRHQLRRNIEALPEVENTSFVTTVTPFSGSTWRMSNTDNNGFYFSSVIYQTDEQHLETMGQTLSAGRWFEPGDNDGPFNVAVVNRSLKDTYYPDVPIIDSIIPIGDELKIIGVVDHFKYHGEFEEEQPTTLVYEPIGDDHYRSILVRLRPGTPNTFEETLNETIAAVVQRRDFVIQSLDQERIQEARITWIPLIMGLAIGGFLIINIALGLFGVLYYTISKRRAEIGLRRALGASQGEISWQFTMEIFLLSVFAMLFAILLAIQLPMLQLVDIPSENLYWSIALTAAIIGGVVLLCALAPSWQAARIHPATALHEE